MKRELTFDVAQISPKIMLYSIPFSLVLCVLFFMIWKSNFGFYEIYHSLIGWKFFAAVVLGIPVHELIHGIFFAGFAKSGIRSVKFGIMRKVMLPYCHCSESLKISKYIIAAAAPGVVLGIFPVVYSFFAGRTDFLIFGIFYIIGAGGDFLMIWMLRNEKKSTFVLDHESKAGCWIIEN
jgi:hypothetical protein